MSDIIEFRHSDLADALYYFEYHGPLKKKIDWIDRDKDARELYRIIREIKFARFKHFLPWARNIAILHEIDTPKKLVRYVEKNPPRGKFGEKWLEEIQKLSDIVTEIMNYYKKNILTKDIEKELEELRKEIKKKYSKYWSKLQEESQKLPGISWRRKEPIVCLLYPIDGKLSHRLAYSDVAYIETSKIMLERDDMFLHEIIKLLNYSKPIGSWVRQDRRGIRAIAYELFTELQTLKLVNSLTGKNPNFRSIINEKMYDIWIPFIRPGTSFDEDELERILGVAYKKITKKEFDGLYQLGELYTELNIILLT